MLSGQFLKKKLDESTEKQFPTQVKDLTVKKII
jgi:hypothetical protein